MISPSLVVTLIGDAEHGADVPQNDPLFVHLGTLSLPHLKRGSLWTRQIVEGSMYGYLRVRGLIWIVGQPVCLNDSRLIPAWTPT